MFEWLNGLLDRVFAVAGAFLFSQIPHFFQHYTHRLGGHLAELQLQVNTLQRAAGKSGKTLHEYGQKFLVHSDEDFVSQGEMIQGIITRHADLSEAYSSLLNSGSFTRLFSFFEHFHSDIVLMTLKNYTVGLTFSLEGAIYTLLGIGFGYLFYWVISRLILKTYTVIKSSIK
ncbi:MAG: DUF2937 family protein [Waddliaceae bacterium]